MVCLDFELGLLASWNGDGRRLGAAVLLLFPIGHLLADAVDRADPVFPLFCGRGLEEEGAIRRHDCKRERVFGFFLRHWNDRMDGGKLDGARQRVLLRC